MTGFSLRRRLAPAAAAMLCIMTTPAPAAWSINPFEAQPVSTAPGRQHLIQSVPDGAGGLLTVWADGRPAPDGGIFAQRYSPAGEPLWGSAPVRVSSILGLFHLSVAGDGQGGAVIAYSNDTERERVYANRITSEGVLAWGDPGVLVAEVDGFVGKLKALPHGDGGLAVVVLHTRLHDADGDEERVDNLSVALLGGNGARTAWVPLDAEDAADYNRVYNSWEAAEDGKGGVVVAWGYEAGVYVPRGPHPVTTQFRTARVGSAGSLVWKNTIPLTPENRQPVGGLAVSASPDASSYHVAWLDFPDFPDESSYRTHVQRLDPAGQPQWGLGGVAVTNAQVVAHRAVRLISVGSSAFVAWWDQAVGGMVWAQRLSPDGKPVWGPTGIRLGPAPTVITQPSLKLAWEPVIGLTAAWADNYISESGPGHYDLVVQRVSPSGHVLWGEGRLVASAASGELVSEIVPGLNGGAYVAWSRPAGSPDSPEWDVFATRIFSPGSFLAPRQRVHVRAAGTSNQVITWYASGREADVGRYLAGDAAISYWLAPEDWSFSFLYDYAAGAFTQAVYRHRD